MNDEITEIHDKTNFQIDLEPTVEDDTVNEGDILGMEKTVKEFRLKVWMKQFISNFFVKMRR